MIDKKTIETQGTYKKTVYGICKEFAWKVYNYKGNQYQVSTFSSEIIKVDRIYCELCGHAFLPSKITIRHGLNECLSCAKQTD